MRRAITILTSILLCHAVSATGAYPHPVTVRQPDGSSIRLMMHGDEFCRWVTNVWGHPVRQDADGVWRTVSARSAGELEAVHASNMSRMLSSDSRLLTRAVPSDMKDVKVLVIPVQFSDVTFVREDYRSYLDRKLNLQGYSEEGASGSVRDWFEANFPEHSFTFDVCDVVTARHEESYYGHNDESDPSDAVYDVNVPELIAEVCRMLDPDVDFSVYDQDSDGVIDHLAIVFAGYDEAEGGGGDAIWSHEWNLSAQKHRFDGVHIGLYAAAAELRGATGSHDAGIGTFCHELSHTFGLKDLYDVDYGSSGLCNCLWKTLSVMDYGNFNNDGHTPPYYCAIDRELAGTAEYGQLEAGAQVSMEPVKCSGKVYRWDTGTEGEYFLFEMRTEEGWDQYIGGHGMLVYHIDRSDSYVDGVRASVRWSENIINTVSGHECADLVEAYDRSSSTKQLFFPGQCGVTEFGPVTSPAFESWDGTSQMIKLAGIREDGDCLAFSVVSDSSERALHVLNPMVTPYQTDASITWECDKTGSSLWGVRWAPEGGVDYDMIEVRSTECTITPLEADRQYRAEIFHIGRTGNGDTTAVSFSTMGFFSSYPCIYLTRSFFYPGETLKLKTLNVQEPVTSIQWYLNGLKTEDSVVLQQTGKMELKAVLTYAADGSQESICRWITVKERDDE